MYGDSSWYWGSHQNSSHTRTIEVVEDGSSKTGNPTEIWGRVYLMCCTKWGSRKDLASTYKKVRKMTRGPENFQRG
ncbi:hypothetical protein L208DRAFT_1396366 [Tricholoma matsutake]|nr:hypothetical protein L208DRAFT_1396366 [Tricholoma matsutake 945]